MNHSSKLAEFAFKPGDFKTIFGFPVVLYPLIHDKHATLKRVVMLILHRQRDFQKNMKKIIQEAFRERRHLHVCDL